MTGYLKHYLSYIFMFFIVTLGGALFYLDAFAFSMAEDQPVHAFVWVLAPLIIIAAIAVMFTSSRLTAFVFNGFIGFAIALLFVVFRAQELEFKPIVVDIVYTEFFFI